MPQWTVPQARAVVQQHYSTPAADCTILLLAQGTSTTRLGRHTSVSSMPASMQAGLHSKALVHQRLCVSKLPDSNISDVDVLLCALYRCACAGVASSIVGCEHEVTRIDVVKRGERVVNRPPARPVLPWGKYSAFQVCDNRAWFAVPFAVSNSVQYGSWIGVSRL